MNRYLFSPLGDSRERAVACVWCRRETWNWDAACDRCHELDEQCAIDEAIADVECDRLASLEWRGA